MLPVVKRLQLGGDGNGHFHGMFARHPLQADRALDTTYRLLTEAVTRQSGTETLGLGARADQAGE